MRLAGSFAIVITLSLALPALPTLEAHAALPANVLDGKAVTKEQFAVLPDSALIDTPSGRMTVGTLRRAQARNAAVLARRVEVMKIEAAKDAAQTVRQMQREDAARLITLSRKNRAEAAEMASRPPAPAYGNRPELQSMPTTIEPGVFVALGGRGFGAVPGKVVMKGLPGGDRALAINAWKSSVLGVTIPADIVGVKDQTVKLQVIRQDGAATVEREVAFRAAREFVHFLPASLVTCADKATDDDCDASKGFFGIHTNASLWETDANGCDVWQIPALQNGWTIHDWTVTPMSNGDGGVRGVLRPKPGATEGQWAACWHVRGSGGFSSNAAGYMGSYVIAGPKGIPYK
jgi:hypothetical protein